MPVFAAKHHKLGLSAAAQGHAHRAGVDDPVPVPAVNALDMEVSADRQFRFQPGGQLIDVRIVLPHALVHLPRGAVADHKRRQAGIDHGFRDGHFFKPPDLFFLQPVIHILQDAGAAASALPDPVRVRALQPVNPVILLVSPDKGAGSFLPERLQQLQGLFRIRHLPQVIPQKQVFLRALPAGFGHAGFQGGTVTVDIRHDRNPQCFSLHWLVCLLFSRCIQVKSSRRTERISPASLWLDLPPGISYNISVIPNHKEIRICAVYAKESR